MKRRHIYRLVRRHNCLSSISSPCLILIYLRHLSKALISFDSKVVEGVVGALLSNWFLLLSAFDLLECTQCAFNVQRAEKTFRSWKKQTWLGPCGWNPGCPWGKPCDWEPVLPRLQMWKTGTIFLGGYFKQEGLFSQAHLQNFITESFRWVLCSPIWCWSYSLWEGLISNYIWDWVIKCGAFDGLGPQITSFVGPKIETAPFHQLRITTRYLVLVSGFVFLKYFAASCLPSFPCWSLAHIVPWFVDVTMFLPVCVSLVGQC